MASVVEPRAAEVARHRQERRRRRNCNCPYELLLPEPSNPPNPFNLIIKWVGQKNPPQFVYTHPCTGLMCSLFHLNLSIRISLYFLNSRSNEGVRGSLVTKVLVPYLFSGE
jgi:hypothetical protein